MAKKIYVGNMSFDTTEDDLKALFSAYGEVVSANVITDRYTGRSRGFGFVEMSADEEAGSAIAELNEKEVNGRILKVNEAKEKPRRDDRRY
jgi:RNA recognition motif-containing protein